MGALVDMSPPHSPLRFFDKDTYPTRATTLAEGVRIVPGGSSIRDGAYVAPGVICMPPMYVNVGAYVEDRKSTRLNSSHRCISYAVFCLKKKKNIKKQTIHTERTTTSCNKNHN